MPRTVFEIAGRAAYRPTSRHDAVACASPRSDYRFADGTSWHEIEPAFFHPARNNPARSSGAQVRRPGIDQRLEPELAVCRDVPQRRSATDCSAELRDVARTMSADVRSRSTRSVDHHTGLCVNQLDHFSASDSSTTLGHFPRGPNSLSEGPNLRFQARGAR